MGVGRLCHDCIHCVSLFALVSSMTRHPDVVLAKRNYFGSVVKKFRD